MRSLEGWAKKWVLVDLVDTLSMMFAQVDANALILAVGFVLHFLFRERL
jgi:hypothetical protein